MSDLSPDILESNDFKEAVSKAAEAQAEKQVSEATGQLRESITNLENTNKTLVGEKRELESDFKGFKKQFEGYDPEALKLMQEKLAEVDNDETRKLLAEGEFEKVYAKERAELVAQHEGQLKAIGADNEAALKDLNGKLEESETGSNLLMQTLVTKVRDDGITNAFTSADAKTSQILPVRAIADMKVTVGEERLPVIEVDKHGDSTFRNIQTGEILVSAKGKFNYNDWLNYLADEEGVDLFSKPNSHSEGNFRTDVNPTGQTKRGMSAEQKKEFKAKYGIAKYNALPLGDHKKAS